MVVSAAEASGDLLGGPLVEALRVRRPNLHVTGIAGPAMRAAGVTPIGRTEELGVAGLVEVVPALPRVLRLRRRLQAALASKPRVAVLIDAPDLHLRLHGPARALGVRTVQLVAPQFWAWRPGRAKALASIADRVLCLFRWEVEALRAHGADAVWVGHPVLERTQSRAPTGQGRPRLVLLPGSRGHERRRCERAFAAAATALGDSVEVHVADAKNGLELLRAADLAVVAPGTATLEAALLGVPLVCAGALHPVSGFVARRLLAVDHVALPNLVLGRAAVPEVLQDLSVPALLAPLRPILADLAAAQQRAQELADELRAALGPPGFAARAADAVLDLAEAA